MSSEQKPDAARVARKLRACTHFNGIQNKVCRAGLKYPSPIPCIPLNHLLTKPGDCPKYQPKTQEEVDAEEAAADAAIKMHMSVMPFVSQWRTKPKPAAERYEVVECPACKGKLHLSQSSYNGHVHGRCETDGCVNWME